MNRNLASFCALAALAASCSLTNPIPLGSDALSEAYGYAAASEWEDAWQSLRALDSDDLDRATLVDYNLISGDAAWETERFAQALRYYEQFLSLRGPAADSRLAEQRTFQVASEMLKGEHRTLLIFPNRWRGRSALQNLAAFAPESPYAPEALATVAGYSYERGDFDEAAIDYQLLLARYRNSEWGDLATFRLGMCGHFSSLDASTNRQLTQVSRLQLDEYLRLYPEGRFREEAQEASSALSELEADYFIQLADYYDRIDVPGATARYLEIAAGYTGTEAAARARDRLATLPASARADAQTLETEDE
ncbi:MAG: outer membrane protein assembly factor BamD [Planctomycetes bacterium]|nr:outer membrane protein assembly factor BamD [Planctomycetota bacterium]